MDPFENMFRGSKLNLTSTIQTFKESLDVLEKAINDDAVDEVELHLALTNVDYNCFSMSKEIAIYERCESVAFKMIWGQ